jgi:signal peptide peptidase SppA
MSAPPRPQGFPNIASQLLNRPLAIHPHKAEVLVCALQQKLGVVSLNTIDGVTLEAKEMLDRTMLAQKGALARDASYDRDNRKSYEMSGDIAVIRIEGTLVHKAGWLDAMSGFCGYNLLSSQFEAALADPDVLGIWVEIDSPGGAVSGLFALVEEIANMTQSMGGKPIYAWVNEQACSAAYAIASVCDKVYGPEDAMVGSIGCVMVHTSMAGALADNGIAVTVIRSGERKMRGNKYEDLDEATEAKFQASVDDVRARFANLVAMGRQITAEQVLATEADWFEGSEAVSLGLMDAVLPEREAWRLLEDECDQIKRQRRRSA